MEEKEIRIVCVGRPTACVGVTTQTSVVEALRYADMEDFEGTVYGEDEAKVHHLLGLSDKVNGYERLILTNKVKGGC